MSPQRHCIHAVSLFSLSLNGGSSAHPVVSANVQKDIQINLLVLFSISNIIPIPPWGAPNLLHQLQSLSHLTCYKTSKSPDCPSFCYRCGYQSLLVLFVGISLTRTNFHADQFLSQALVIHQLTIIIFCPSASLTWNHPKLLYVLS